MHVKSSGLGHTQSRSPISLLTAVRINWELVAVDLPPFFSPFGRKNGVRAYKKLRLCIRDGVYPRFHSFWHITAHLDLALSCYFILTDKLRSSLLLL